MAFVYKSERDVNPIRSPTTGDLGPGQYLPQGFIGTRNKLSNVGFDSNTYREMKLTKNDNPGPGSYEKDDAFEKFADLFNDRSYKSPTLLKSLEMVGPDSLDPYTIIINKEKSKDVAFFSKEKRFKESPNSDFPGPSDYGMNDPKFLVKNSMKEKNKKAMINNIKRKNSLIKKEKSSTSAFRQISIPSKNLCFGFEVDNRGDIYVKEDPDKDIRYSGERLDSVGPGSYEIYDKDKWNKGFVNWDKMAKNERNSVNKSQEYQIDNVSLGNVNNIEEIVNKNNRDTPINKKILNNNLIRLTSRGNGFISKKNDFILADQSFKFKKEKVFKHFMDKRQKLLDMKISKSMAEDDLFDKHILNQEPGPGYYSSEHAKASFKPPKIPEKYQYFGSNSLRFVDSNSALGNDNEDVGPGVYFKDENKYGNENKKVLIKEKNNYFFNYANQREELKKIRSENYEERVGISDIVNQYKLSNIDNSPGPGNYDIDKGKHHKKSISNVAQFGSLQKRFSDDGTAKNPGPGSYIGIPKSDSFNLIRFPIRPKKIKVERENKTEAESLFSKSQKDEKKNSKPSPGVGDYNIDIVDSVGYKIAKNVNKFNHSSAPFNSVEKRFKKYSLDLNSNIGPGKYHKDDSSKNLLKKQMHNSPPFNIGSERKIITEKINTVDNGPGAYNLSSYFDWNKKSFNVQFI